MLVTIYLETSIHGPARRDGAGAWLIEYINSKGEPVTRPIDKNEEIIYLENTTEATLNLELLADALPILTKACQVRINTKCEHILQAINNEWVNVWSRDEWKKANGTEIKNADLWRQVYEYMNIHEVFAEYSDSKYRTMMSKDIIEELRRNGHV